MSEPSIVSEIADGVLTITLNRPEVLNSFDRAMALGLQGALGRAAADEAVRAVLLTGAGRAFCAGQDLAAVLPADGGEPTDLGAIVRECYNPIVRAIAMLEKPVVAAVNGIAAGAGANLALACDFVVASEEASFVQSFVHVGLIPDSGGTWMLPQLVGRARAAQLAMLGEKLPAPRALEWGMIFAVAPAAEVIGVGGSARAPTGGDGDARDRAHEARVPARRVGDAGRAVGLRGGVAGRGRAHAGLCGRGAGVCGETEGGVRGRVSGRRVGGVRRPRQRSDVCVTARSAALGVAAVAVTGPV